MLPGSSISIKLKTGAYERSLAKAASDRPQMPSSPPKPQESIAGSRSSNSHAVKLVLWGFLVLHVVTSSPSMAGASPTSLSELYDAIANGDMQQVCLDSDNLLRIILNSLMEILVATLCSTHTTYLQIVGWLSLRWQL